MITPHKYLNLDKSVLNCSSRMIELFLERKIIKYESLFSILEKDFDSDIYELFIPSLNLLFCLGKIRYIIDMDILEWIE